MIPTVLSSVLQGLSNAHTPSTYGNLDHEISSLQLYFLHVQEVMDFEPAVLSNRKGYLNGDCAIRIGFERAFQ